MHDVIIIISVGIQLVHCLVSFFIHCVKPLVGVLWGGV